VRIKREVDLTQGPSVGRIKWVYSNSVRGAWERRRPGGHSARRWSATAAFSTGRQGHGLCRSRVSVRAGVRCQPNAAGTAALPGNPNPV
jgi:hypothetical protein